MIEPKCNTCLNSRAVVSENGVHYICTLSGTKPFYCLVNGDYYQCDTRLKEMRDFKEALRKVIDDYENA